MAKKKKPIHPKRVQQEGDDGWTTILTIRSRHQQQRPPHQHAAPGKLEPAEIPRGCTVDVLRQEMARQETIWMDSPCREELDLHLRRIGDGRDLLQISRCICVGLGSLTDERSRKVAMLQLCAMRHCLAELGIDI